MLAGLVANIALSTLMALKMMMGLMPQLDIAKMIAGTMGSPDTPLIGWIVHFAIGIVVYGVAIAVLDGKLPGFSHVGHCLMLGVVGWLIMMPMPMPMPMTGVGLFGMNMGSMTSVMTLVLHLIFGAVLGWVYGRSIGTQDLSTSRARA